MIVWLAIVGFVLSIYAIYIFRTKDKKHFCDISKRISCTKAFYSKYGKTFGMPNGFWGAVFYLAILLLIFFNFESYIIYLAVMGCLVSIYLAYLLYFKVRTFCIVCTATYIINFTILLLSI